MTRTARTILPLAAVCLCAAALAQDAQPADDAPALSGPTVEKEAKEATLVHRGYDGELEPLDAPPEVAALDLLHLDGETREKIEDILTERAAFIDGVVIRNIQTLVEFQAAKAAGDISAQLEMLAPLIEQLRELRLRGRLVDQIKRTLPAGVRDEYQRLVLDRQMAELSDLKAEAEVEGVPNPDAVAARRYFFAALGQEIKASYDRVVVQNTQRFDELLAKLDLDPETEGDVRRLVTDFAQRTALNPTAEQRRELFGQVYRILPADARRRLADLFRPGGDD